MILAVGFTRDEMWSKKTMRRKMETAIYNHIKVYIQVTGSGLELKESR